MNKKYNPSDADEAPPAYQETADPPFNPNFAPSHSPSPPHTPDINTQQRGQPSQSLYPQIPSNPSTPSAPILFPQPQHYQQQPQHPQHPQQHPNQVRYQAIQIPYNVTNDLLRERRRRQSVERRRFPLGAIFFLFGWFCPPLWVIGACCCAGSRNEYESFWGKVNFIMAMILIVTSLVYSAFAMTQYM